jgi:prepilin-type N-terminal cleavage/methylation domain-containing protein/prepilin-type processing-associated H-X9-DG protein
MNIKKHRAGFTLIELLVVIAVIAILAAILLPVLGKAKLKAQGIYCLNNLKQLQLAIIMYTSDNQEKFPENPGAGTSLQAWVPGVMTWDNPIQPNLENTNIALLTGGEVGPYISQCVGVFKCPADTIPGAKGSRVRSVSMNGFVGDVNNIANYISGQATHNWIRILKTSDLKLGAVNTWVLLDECPDSINDAFFAVQMQPGGSAVWTDVPASTHNGAGGFSFADGHVELKKWLNGNTKALVRRLSPCPDNGLHSPDDLAWLQERTTTEVMGAPSLTPQ